MTAGRLVLTRRENESVLLGTSDGLITVTVCGVHEGKVRLAFGAPRDRVAIWREELVPTAFDRALLASGQGLVAR